jgi:WD40 repeat protein
MPLSKTGRNETPQTFSNGSALVDFGISPHRKKGDSELPMRVFCGGEDGRIRVVEIKQDDTTKEIETEAVCQLEGMDQVIQGEWHPLARDLIALLCHDAGKCEIRLWDISNGEYRRIALAYSVIPLG